MAKTGKVKVDIEFNQPAPEGRQIKTRTVTLSKYYDDKGKVSSEEWREEVTFEDEPAPKVIQNPQWNILGHTNDTMHFEFVPDDEAVTFATGGLISNHASGSAIDLNKVHVGQGKIYSAPINTALD